MASLNQVQIIGNLGQDPEIRYMPNGDAVANISVATSEHWKDKESGEKKEATEWHRVTFYRRLAEVVGEYLTKGSSIFVQGKLRTRKWQDKDGVDRYTTEIIADQMVMLGSKQGGEGQRSSGRSTSNSSDYGAHRGGQDQRKPQTRGQAFDDMDDDIPF